MNLYAHFPGAWHLEKAKRLSLVGQQDMCGILDHDEISDPVLLIQKPFTIDDLAGHVRQVLDRRDEQA